MRRGSKNNNWKGGRSIASNGYVLIRAPFHPLADVRGYAYEHRLVAESMLGRQLREGELVHHKDGDKTNNDPSNLEVFGSIGEHFFHHRKDQKSLQIPGEPNPEVLCACGCGTRFRRYDPSRRPRRFVSGHNTSERNRTDGRNVFGKSGEWYGTMRQAFIFSCASCEVADQIQYKGVHRRAAILWANGQGWRDTQQGWRCPSCIAAESTELAEVKS